MTKRVVYTNIIGDYESLNEDFILDSPDIPLLCLTDNKNLKSEKWQIIYVEPKFPLDQVRSSRHLKIIGHEILNEFEEIMWVDNTVKIKSDAIKLFDIYLKNNDLVILNHSYRNALKDEFIEILNLGYDDPFIILKQMTDYHKESNELLRSKVYWTGIMLKKNNAVVKKLMKEWYQQVHKYSKRDQLSLPYVLSKVKINFESININAFESDFHQWPLLLNRTPRNTQKKTLNYNLILDSLFDSKLNSLEAKNLEITNLKETIVNLSAFIDKSNKILKGITSSKSWKLTKPLREVNKFLKQL